MAEAARETGLPPRSISHLAGKVGGLVFPKGNKRAMARVWSKPEYREKMRRIVAANAAKRWQGHEAGEKWMQQRRLEVLAANCFRFSKLLTPRVEQAAGRRMMKLRESEVPKAKRSVALSEGFWGKVEGLLEERGPMRKAQLVEATGATERHVSQQLALALEDGRVVRREHRNGHAGGWVWMLPDVEKETDDE